MRIISIDGGGYLGLATAAFIEGIESHFNTSLHQEFELFCGTSTGAVIVLGLAAGMKGKDIVDLYKTLGEKVFQKRRNVPLLARRCPGVFRARYDLEPLRTALNNTFGQLTLGDLLSTGKKILVTSYSVSTGQPRLFKTDHSSQLSLHNRYLVADIALASAAAPTYFPLASVTNPANNVTEVFCDGGVVANHPALLGFAEAVCELQIAPHDVKVLSISTPRADLAEPSTKNFDRGVFAWRRSLPAILVDSPSKISHELLRRLVMSYGAVSPLYQRIDLRNQSQLSFDRADPASTQELLLIGATEAASNEVRKRLGPFLNGVQS
jgi:patatin-like phospholipase/acyl hydrolase